MRHRDTRSWMLGEAVDLLHLADRLQRQFFQIGRPGPSPCWEPPVDMYLDARELILLIALPGVTAQGFEVSLEAQAVLVRGERSIGIHVGPGAILRMEIPHGRFERRIPLPEGEFRLNEDMHLENGCLKVTLERLG